MPSRVWLIPICFFFFFLAVLGKEGHVGSFGLVAGQQKG
jgi:hypothetical protein